jgi:hypothetical protein
VDKGFTRPPLRTDSRGEKYHLRTALFDDCCINLDSPVDDSKVNELLEKIMPILVFRRCLAVYRGGSIGIIQGPIVENPKRYPNGHGQQGLDLHNVPMQVSLQFENCVFQLQLDQEPYPEGKRFAKALLASDSDTFLFTVTATRP